MNEVLTEFNASTITRITLYGDQVEFPRLLCMRGTEDSQAALRPDGSRY